MASSLFNFFSGAAVGAFIAVTAMLGQQHSGREYIAVVTALSILFGLLHCIWCIMNKPQAGHVAKIAKTRRRVHGGSATYAQPQLSRVRSAQRVR